MASLAALADAFPDNTRIRRRQGLAEIAQGNVDAGLRTLRHVVEEHPGDAVSVYELGRALVQSGRPGEAEPVLAELVKRASSFTPAWFVLGDAQVELERYDDALRSYREGAAKDPFRPALDNVKNELRSGRHDGARRLLAEILGEDPAHTEALAGLEVLAMGAGDWIEAERIMLEMRRRTRYWPTLLLGLSQLYLMTSRFEEASVTLGTLTRIEPHNTMAWNMAGTVSELLMRTGEAIRAFRRSLEIDERQPRAHVSIGNALRVAGDRTGSERAYRRALEVDPGNGEAWWALSNLKDHPFSDDEIDAMEAALRGDAASLHTAAPLHFALGKALEDRGLFDSAFEHFAAGNRIQKQASGFDATLFEQEIDRIARAFDRDLFVAGQQSADEPAATPVFVVGMPRTGSTLVEQILASHSGVDATMELPFIGQYVREISGRNASIGPYPESVRRMAPEDFKALADRYLAASRPYRGTASLFTDKSPENFVHAGLIALMFPNAFFIDVQRHPLDTCISAFRQRFAVGGGYTYDIVDLGRYYRGYRRLMRHWTNLLPERVYSLVYENLVTDPASEIPRLLAFLGLRPEDACMRPEATSRPVRTPSSEQVREPISTRRIGTWKLYREHLLELPGMLQPELRDFKEALLSDELRSRLF